MAEQAITFRLAPSLWMKAGATKLRVIIEGESESDHIVRRIAATGAFYEADLLEHLMIRGPRGGLVIDAGAHVGNHTLFFAVVLGGRVIAIEPDAASRAVLQRNLTRNGVVATVEPRAVSDLEGEGMLRPGGVENRGSSALSASEGVPVQVTTIDELVSSDEAAIPVTLIKIDVEGHEREVLAGGSGTILRWRPDVVVEAAAEESRCEIFEFFSSIDYECLGRFCATPTYHFRARERAVERGRPLDRLWYRLESFRRRVGRFLSAG